jgi:ribulose-phosphate 3-epimerase
MEKRPLVAPSILSADFLRLGEELEMLERSVCDWVHVDVMDGRFVPNISFGFPVMEVLRKKTSKPLDVHLMIEEPMRHARRFAELGAATITVHYEAEVHLHRSLTEIASWNVRPGVAINPHTPVNHLEHILEMTGLVLVMSVNPGFGGQKFIPETFRKLEQLTALRANRKLNFLIEVDGGVSTSNAPQLKEAGADVLVAGNTVFSSPNPELAIRKLKLLS